MSDCGFIPHPECTDASGACFYEGACTSQCVPIRKSDLAARIADLDERLARLEAIHGRPSHAHPAQGGE